ncbi:MAG: hypothetical protein H8Z69_00730 [Nanohaloarchaea archaeon]|nr:hypothetical protein [Candidatus Nanohaloarchaea archaeon]
MKDDERGSFNPLTSMSRREFFGKTGIGLKYWTGFHSSDTAINAYRQIGVDELGLSSKHGTEEAQEVMKGENQVNIYVFDEAVGGQRSDLPFNPEMVGISMEPKGLEDAATELEPYFESLGDIEVDLNFYRLEPDEEVMEKIKSSGVKQLDNEDNEAYKEIKRMLGSTMENGYTGLAGPFDTEFGDYKGTKVEEDVFAVSNTRSWEYVGNQLIHNWGHVAGAQHAVLGPYYHPMSWGLSKEFRAHYELMHFGPETRQKFRSKTE